MKNNIKFLSNYLIPAFSLLFFIQGARVFINGIYYDNLATLSLNVSLIFILIFFLTPLGRFLIPSVSSEKSIFILGITVLVLRSLLVFMFPIINPRSDSTPMLMLVILISGLLAFVSIGLFGKSLYVASTTFQGKFKENNVALNLTHAMTI